MTSNLWSHVLVCLRILKSTKLLVQFATNFTTMLQRASIVVMACERGIIATAVTGSIADIILAGQTGG